MMDHNPYSPPQTEVRETPSPENEAGPRPAQVTWAIGALCADVAASMVQFFLTFNRTGADPEFVIYAMIGVAVVVFASESFLIYKLATRRNWARYAMLVLSTLGLMSWLQDLRRELVTFPLSAALSAGQVVLDAVAMYLVFTRPGKDWFKKRPAG